MGSNVVGRAAMVVVVGVMGSPQMALAEDDVESSVETLPLIRVTEGRLAAPASEVLASEPVERLASDPSVSLSRMGGRGLDPIIRGQGQERVDVLLDGIRVEGACPNRMDPPTSRLSAALVPVLQVRTTNQTLRWGPISGGQLVATTPAPDLGDEGLAGHVTVGGSDNGDGKQVNAGVAVGGDNGWLRLAGGYEEADDYQDGDGNDVRSAFKNTEGRIDAAWLADNGFYIKGLFSRQEERDVKYAGSGMDAPKTDTDIARIELGAPVARGEWNLLAWQADVDHIMDNFSLRGSAMKMLTDSETLTRGLRLTLDQSPDARTDWAVGFDVESNNWEAERFGGASLDTLTSVLWPDVDRNRLGLFAERFYRLTSTLQLGGGVRYDRVEMEAGTSDKTFGNAMMPMSAASIYETVYGTTNTDAEDNNVSGFITSDWRFSRRQSLEVTASHSVRSPGVTERYIASWSMNPAMRWVGNPALDTEKHNKLEVALSGRSDGWHWRPALWIDQVDDFVLRTRDASQTSVYRNIDARLMGAEGVLGWSDGTWSSTSSLAVVHGENRDDNKALPQIPPVQFVQTLGWQHLEHQVELEWQLARRQDHVDLESGLDAGTSPGYGVLNLSGTHPIVDFLSFNWAVDNLFDNTWAYHVSRANTDPFSPEAVRVNEPGRTLRAALTARW